MCKKGFCYISVANIIIGNMTSCSHENLISTPQINTAHPYQWVDYITGTKEGIENVLAEWTASSAVVLPYFSAHPTNATASKTSSGTGFVYGMKGYKPIDGYSKPSYTQQNITPAWRMGHELAFITTREYLDKNNLISLHTCAQVELRNRSCLSCLHWISF